MAALQAAMQADFDYAWMWQCNLAMAFYDEGVDAYRANRGAARFMQHAFGVNITASERFKELMDMHEGNT